MGFVSRRRFLGSAAAIPLALHPRLARLAAASLTAGSDRRNAAPARATCLLVDAGEHCALPESLAGFARGLEAASIPYRRVAAVELEPARLIVAPGALLPSSEFAATLSRLCRLGSTVIYESGAAFATAEAFRNEQRLLKTHLEMGLQTPVDLWDGTLYRALGQPAPPPYVYYHWPARTMVRDFSRALPVYGSGADSLDVVLRKLAYNHDRSIAFVRGVPVARRSRLGHGEVIVLGSPLGPHLGGRDRQAQVLLEALLLQR